MKPGGLPSHQQRSGVWLGGAAVSRVTLQREDFGCDLEAFRDNGLFQRNAHDLYL